MKQNDQTVDRPVKDIVLSIQKLIFERKIKGQLARDLDKLCAIAFKSEEAQS